MLVTIVNSIIYIALIHYILTFKVPLVRHSKLQIQNPEDVLMIYNEILFSHLKISFQSYPPDIKYRNIY